MRLFPVAAALLLAGAFPAYAKRDADVSFGDGAIVASKHHLMIARFAMVART
jgi:hypothetical protein